MKRLLTTSIAAGLFAGTMLAPTAAQALSLPVAPGETVRAVAESLPVNPLDRLPSTVMDHRSLPTPVDPLATATAVAGTIRERLTLDPTARTPGSAFPASSAEPAVHVPPKVFCPVTPAVSAPPVDIARRLTPAVGEGFPGSTACRDGQPR